MGSKAIESLTSDVLSLIGLTVLEYQDNGNFNLVGEAPSWFNKIIQKSSPNLKALNLGNLFPSLKNFIDDSEHFWDSNGNTPLKSGIWTVSDFSGVGIFLEASAVKLNGKRILLIEHMDNKISQMREFVNKSVKKLYTKDTLEKEVLKRTKDIRKREQEIALRLIWAAEFRDDETGAHIRRIALYSSTLAKALGWSPHEIEDIKLASSMHDIGKVGIPDRILLKPGKLTSVEYEIMKQHCEIGYKILKNSDVAMLNMAEDIAYYHHEKWDGSGYPTKLSRKYIPESARITAIADVYDALVNRRVYKPAFPEEKAVAIMYEGSGKHFDPYIIEAFMDLREEFKRIHENFHDGEVNLPSSVDT